MQAVPTKGMVQLGWRLVLELLKKGVIHPLQKQQ